MLVLFVFCFKIMLVTLRLFLFYDGHVNYLFTLLIQPNTLKERFQSTYIIHTFDPALLIKEICLLVQLRTRINEA